MTHGMLNKGITIMVHDPVEEHFDFFNESWLQRKQTKLL
jgi:hypothetical protein